VAFSSLPARADLFANYYLLHLLSSQTSCYRFWGQGLWTDYGRGVCRRTNDILSYDY